MILRARQFTFAFPAPALIMGIVNVTPDSFSDGGKFFDKERAVEHAFQLLAEGADILDIGGESTRPRAESVPESEELRRVLPVMEGLEGKTAKALSIDTQKPAVARAALQAGASIVNDIGGSRPGDEMLAVVREFSAGYVLMHMKGTPQTMHLNAQYNNVLGEVSHFIADRLNTIECLGVSKEQVMIDPGIGFAKNADHNFQLLGGLNRLKIHQRPVLVGASRKSFIGKLLGAGANERLPGSLACAVWAVLNGAQIIRTHDVAATVQAIRVIEEIQANCAG